ncbi:PAAR domain-containing protein [Paraburkholderia sp. BL10I2N1]|uniref:PAAR domain-containing protein n=1 Tax=Paraburkholderia sp. BL10I2N1 TaxID=1938796 RepID=UPI0010611A93|nr:PAAR domain-containing protein [Paraburkholderia sp. BL10I2N1]TDN62567.1 PAAR motif-containing protein [Paraburkholderia sp. BL10I2N1]
MQEQQKNETTYLFVTIGSRTRRGGRVTRVTTQVETNGQGLARVGDVVTYDDGSAATIIDGAGCAALCEDKPLALVGSRLSNGDTITETMQDEWGITVRHGEQIPGLFDPSYTMPPTVATHEGGTDA